MRLHVCILCSGNGGAARVDRLSARAISVLRAAARRVQREYERHLVGDHRHARRQPAA